MHAPVVDGTGPAEEELEEADDKKVEKGANQEEKKEGAKGRAQVDKGDGNREPEAAISRDLQSLEDRTGDGLTDRVDVE